MRHRLAEGRLHPVLRGVYAVGRPQLDRAGHWMAAVLRCGPGAAISHGTAAAAWKILVEPSGRIEVSVGRDRAPRPDGIRVQRRRNIPAGELTRLRGIPLTAPGLTLVDIAARVSAETLEAAVNEADQRARVALSAAHSPTRPSASGHRTQVRFEPDHVRRTLAEVASRLVAGDDLAARPPSLAA